MQRRPGRELIGPAWYERLVSGKRQIIKAMAVIRRPDGSLLVSESAEPLFQRPLGGHVEFGEYAADTIHREFGEELGQVVTDVRRLGVLENIFPWEGGTEHEVVFIFTAAFADPAAYEIEEQPILDNPERRVLWRPADAVSPPLYPAGLPALIASVAWLADVASLAGVAWLAGHGRSAARRSILVSAGSARIPQIRVARPPMTSAQRAPATCPAQPTIGPPTGVEPSQASAHRAITRPRISGLAAS